jgi:histidine triad (HIT) family protein
MEETLFTKIIARKIPAKIAYEDEKYIAIHDIAPQAPLHLLIITKQPIATLNDLKPADAELVGGMFLLAATLAKKNGHGEYRTVFNCGATAGQSVFHLHLHVLAGRTFTWPPG